MARSTTDICNQALSHIGKGAIGDINQDDSPEAVACKRFYDEIRKDVLEDFDWSFARQVEQLPLHAEDSANGRFPYQYLRPAKCIAIRRMAGDKDGFREVNYDQGIDIISGTAELQVIWSDFLNPWITFTRDVTSNELFSPKFVRAFSYRLAAELAPSLSLERKQRSMMTMYTGIRAEAEMSDANQFGDQKNETTLFGEVSGDSGVIGYFP